MKKVNMKCSFQVSVLMLSLSSTVRNRIGFREIYGQVHYRPKISLDKYSVNWQDKSGTVLKVFVTYLHVLYNAQSCIELSLKWGGAAIIDGIMNSAGYAAGRYTKSTLKWLHSNILCRFWR